MKQFILRAFKFLLAVLFPGLLLAQSKPDYTVQLNSGNFTPLENSSIITKDSEILQNSLFQKKYYLTLQFKTLPDQQKKIQLEAAGIQLIDYLPNLAYTAVLKQNVDPTRFKNLNIRSVFQLRAAQKTVPALLSKDFPAHAIKQPGFVDVTIITYEKLDAGTVGKELKKVKATIQEEMPMFRSFTVRVSQTNITKLIDLPFVQWVEPIDAPNVPENLLGRTLHRVNVLNDGVRNLKGDSVNIGIWDGGEVSPHLDFTPVSSRLTMMETNQQDSHSTHVAGTIGGRGIINPKARGMAPNSKLYSYNFNGNIQTEMAAAIPALSLAVSSHSYGSTQTCGVTGAGVAYSSTSRSTDINLNNFPYHLHVHSAGNSQSACTGGWSTITGSGKSAKNNILVANITSTEAMSSSSSFGPVHDGRVKPEISSFGTNVLSTYLPLNTYGTISGTSMATPGVSGTVALLVQRYKQLHNNVTPVSSLIKATVCNTAQDLGNPGPDYKFGFGRINALNAVRAIEQNRFAINTITTGVTNNIPITIPAGAVKLKVMLTWNDPAGTANAATALVNNLDLSVISGTTTTLPWILNANSPASNATRGIDNVSNIEQVTIDNPAAGTYTLRVNGTAVPSGANQQYSLTWEIDQPYLEVIFPNGNESLSPGSQETITWNNAGITGNQTIQYSLDNGTTWVTLSSTVPATTTRYTWTVPTGANSATALIRVLSGSINDISDANFRILGTPASLNATAGVCPGSLNFSWAAVTNATHYDLFSLDKTTGQWTILSSNISGTTYSASGLTPNADMWFTISAKNNTTGSVSEKALAINRTVPNSGGISLGSISGNNNICSSNQNVTYTVQQVAGVIYSWTLPAGASFVSGQGTNTIVVNYSAGSSSGNISVTGNSSGCQTNTSTLAISVIGTVPAPVSGGDQTICFIAANQPLTATATVPAGYTVVWYSSATGGNIITNPALNTPGTITYYAASKNISGNCESTTRTPVTLTFNAASPASISVNGPTSFCEGNDVTLTAASGTSYLWSNGETSQSITTKNSGQYSVTITQANGCSSVSAATLITVNPKPEVNISAAPVTGLHPGLITTLTATTKQADPVTYSWMKDGKILPGKTSNTLEVTVDELGTYSAVATNTSGCSGTSNLIQISDAASNQVFIYPNPNNGQFQIRYNNKSGEITSNNITVFDAKGARVLLQNHNIKTTYEKMEVDLGKQSRGIYLVVLTDANGKKITASRVVVQ